MSKSTASLSKIERDEYRSVLEHGKLTSREELLLQAFDALDAAEEREAYLQECLLDAAAYLDGAPGMQWHAGEVRKWAKSQS